jgi:ribokinase
MPQRHDVAVVGQIVRDLVLRLDRLPAAGRSAPVRERRETLGGKGANRAVGLSQLGADVALVGVVGDDPVGDAVLARAEADGIDIRPVIRRTGAPTGLIVDIVDVDARWRYLADLPESMLLTTADIEANAAVLAAARAVSVQLQQPRRYRAGPARGAAEPDGCAVAGDGVRWDAPWPLLYALRMAGTGDAGPAGGPVDAAHTDAAADRGGVGGSGRGPGADGVAGRDRAGLECP